jgi:putative FmdB family regulatory protein
MPTYDYVCGGCGAEFEEFQSITAPSLRKCPKCGKLKLKRLIGTGAGIIFKGSGFYETDYRSDSYKSAAKADTQASSVKPDVAATKTGAAATTNTSPAKSDGAPAKQETTAKSEAPASTKPGRTKRGK